MTDPWSTFLTDPAEVPHDVLAETLRSVLELKPSMHGDHAPDPECCQFCEGEAYGLEKVRDRIHNMITYSAQSSANLRGATVMSDSNKRLVTIVLDRSGSMHAVKDDTEGGLRAFLEAQKDAPGETLVTLRQFDTRHDTVFENVPLDEVPVFHLQPRGGTALLDAIGSTVATVGEHLSGLAEDARPGEVVIVILTDGFENSSKEWTLAAVKDAITREQERGWTFVFLGADQDAIKAGAAMGVGRDTSMSYGGAHTSTAMASAGAAVARGSRTGDYGFTDDERTRSGLGGDEAKS